MRTCPLPSADGETQEPVLQLALAKTNDGAFVVCLSNTSDGAMRLGAGTLLGQGGPGKFCELEAADRRVWLFNRLLDFKKDVAARASGGAPLLNVSFKVVFLQN